MKLWDIKLHKSHKTKNIRFCIKSDLVLHIYAPLQYDARFLESLLLEHHQWIAMSMQKIALQNQKNENLLKNYAGKIPAFGIWESKEKYSKKTIKENLEHYIKPRALYFSKLMQVQFKAIGIRYNKRILGSCNSENKLSFSLLLFFADYEEIDYVIIHELSHIIHKNHSKAFWNLVETFCKDFKALRAKLHQKISLFNLLYERYFI